MLEGAGLGLAMTFAVGAVTFYFQRKLPYKKMLIVTGVFIGFVLVVMVGQTVRTMQGTGWMPITPIDVELPYWAGLWLGVYPTVETIGAQIAAAVVRDRLLLPRAGDEGQGPAQAAGQDRFRGSGGGWSGCRRGPRRR